MKTQIPSDLGTLVERAAQLAENPYGDEVAALGPDEPLAVGKKIAAAIRRLAAASPPAPPQEQESNNSELDRLKAEIEDWKSFVDDCDNTAVAREINAAIVCLRDAVNGEYSREDRIVHDALGQGIASVRVNEDLKRKIAARELHIHQLLQEKHDQQQTYRTELAAYSNTVESFKRRAEQAEAKLAASPPAQAQEPLGKLLKQIDSIVETYRDPEFVTSISPDIGYLPLSKLAPIFKQLRQLAALPPVHGWQPEPEDVFKAIEQEIHNHLYTNTKNGHREAMFNIVKRVRAKFAPGWHAEKEKI